MCNSPSQNLSPWRFLRVCDYFIIARSLNKLIASGERGPFLVLLNIEFPAFGNSDWDKQTVSKDSSDESVNECANLQPLGTHNLELSTKDENIDEDFTE